MLLLKITGDGIGFLCLVSFIFLLVFCHFLRLENRKKKTSISPKTITEDSVGYVFKVIELDLPNGKILLQEGVDWMEEFLLFKSWYKSGIIPDDFLVEGKTFKIVFEEGLAFQEAYVFTYKGDEFAVSHIKEIGAPTKK